MSEYGANLMKFNDANDLPQKYEMNSNPEQILAVKKILIFLLKFALLSAKKIQSFELFLVIKQVSTLSCWELIDF